MEIEKVVEQKFGEIIESGFIEDAIKNSLEKSVSSIVENCLESYSDFGKEVKNKIKESLSLGNMKISLPEYNQLICNWVMEIANNNIIQIGKEQVEKNIKKFFQPLEKSEYKISEIIEKFIETEFKNDEDDNECGEITFIIENDHDQFIRWYFDKEPNKRKYDCDYMIGTYKGEIFDSSIEGTRAEKIKAKTMYNFDSFMFQLFALKANIIDDSNNVETEWSNYND